MRIGIIGTGTMGTGIAQSAALAGCEVVLHDREAQAARAAVGRIGASLAKAVAGGKLELAQAEAASARLSISADLAAFAGADMVIEAVAEIEAVKRALFEVLAPQLRPDAVIATNTSSLSVSELARGMVGEERFVGLHYFFPAHVNPLLEVVEGAASSPQAVETALAFARLTGKQPLRCRDVYGFAVNRFFVPYLNESIRLMDEGHQPAAIDHAARSAFGTKAGPFKVMDLSKVEIALHACRTLERLGPFYTPAAGLVAKVEAGGNWDAPDLAEPGPNEAEIARRLQSAVFVAVLDELDQQVAAPADIDMGARLGLQWQWQPVSAMKALSAEKVRDMIAPLLVRAGKAEPKSLGEF